MNSPTILSTPARSWAARGRDAEDHVVLAGVAAEEQSPGGVDQRARRHLPGARAGAQGLGGIGGQAPGTLSVAVGGGGGVAVAPGERGRRGEAGQLAAPERLRARRVLAAQPGDVGTERRRRRQRRSGATEGRRVGAEGFREDDAHGPAVEEEVMVGPQQALERLALARQEETEEGRARRIEALGTVGGQPLRPAAVAFRRRQGAPILDGQRDAHLASHDLDSGFSAFSASEGAYARAGWRSATICQARSKVGTSRCPASVQPTCVRYIPGFSRRR